MIKPIFFHSHDWHVQPDCQRSTSVFRLSGPLWIAKRSLAAVLELVALHVCTRFLRISNLIGPVKENVDFSSQIRIQIVNCTEPAADIRELHNICSTRDSQNATRNAKL